MQVKLAGNNGLAKEVKADLTRTHFTMGNHKFDWQTDAMRTQVSFFGVADLFCARIIPAFFNSFVGLADNRTL